MTPVLLFCGIGAFAFMTGLYFRQRVTNNATSVDAFWALGIAIETALLAWQSHGDLVRRIVISVIVGAWALRLAGHIYFDRVRTGIEDGRYTRFRKEFSAAKFYVLFVIQAVLVFLLPLTFLGGLANQKPFPSALDIFALAVWAIAVFGESTADRQLGRFRANPANKGKTCRDGLWRYSRHPNYFFECLIWIGYIPLAIGSTYFYAALLGPALLVFLILTVSGVPPTEAQALKSRGDDYRRYQKETSVFIPWFPKKDPS